MMASDKEGGTGIGLRIAAGVLAAGLLATAVNPVVQGLRSLNQDPVAATSVGEIPSSASAKFRQVPLFTVTDAEDRPYLAEANDKRSRKGYFFVNPADAEKYLVKVRGMAEGSDGAHVRVITLADALQFVGRPMRGVDKVPERFEIVRDEEQAKAANSLTTGLFDKNFRNGVPLFYVDNLALQTSDNKQMFPIFFDKEKLDIFMAKAKESGSTEAQEPMQVIDLLQTVKEIKAGNNERLKSLEFFPLDDAIEYTQNMKK